MYGIAAREKAAKLSPMRHEAAAVDKEINDLLSACMYSDPTVYDNQRLRMLEKRLRRLRLDIKYIELDGRV